MTSPAEPTGGIRIPKGMDRAEFNRRIVKENLYSEAYEKIERALEHTPLGRPLPDWLPTGTLPEMSREDFARIGLSSGGSVGFTEAEVFEKVSEEIEETVLTDEPVGVV